MAKFIIDIPDEAIDFMGGHDHVSIFAEPECKVGDRKHYALRISKEDITPYAEPDRKAIENEVWEFASMLMNMHPDVAENIYWSINGGKGIGVAAEMTYQEAKSKYEAWKDQKEIRVGDVVEINGTSITGVVTKLEKTKVAVITDDGCACYYSSDSIHKTGSHCPEIEELLKKLRGES